MTGVQIVFPDRVEVKLARSAAAEQRSASDPHPTMFRRMLSAAQHRLEGAKPHQGQGDPSPAGSSSERANPSSALSDANDVAGAQEGQAEPPGSTLAKEAHGEAAPGLEAVGVAALGLNAAGCGQAVGLFENRGGVQGAESGSGVGMRAASGVAALLLDGLDSDTPQLPAQSPNSSPDLPVAIGDGADESARSFLAAGGKFLPPGEASMPGQIVATDFERADSTDLPAILTDGRGRPLTLLGAERPATASLASAASDMADRSGDFRAPLSVSSGVVAMPDLVDGEARWSPPAKLREAAADRTDSPDAPGATAPLPVATTRAGSASEAPSASVPVKEAVGSPAWGQEVGRHLVWASEGGKNWMILKVNPPQLGTVEVHLRVVEGTVHAQFVSPHQAVRAAIEAGLPQLQEAFVGSGLTLGQASVDAGGAGFRGQEAQPQARTAVSPVSGGVAPAEGADLLPSVGRVERSLINLFA